MFNEENSLNYQELMLLRQQNLQQWEQEDLEFYEKFMLDLQKENEKPPSETGDPAQQLSSERVQEALLSRLHDPLKSSASLKRI